ncbi:hypothetical protein RYX36_021022 [Vicia faba]
MKNKEIIFHEDVKTLGEGVISKNESILMVCTTNSKEYRLILKITQPINNMTTNNDESFDLIGLVKSRTSILYADENVSLYDPIVHLGSIKLIILLSCIMIVKSSFLDRMTVIPKVYLLK